MSALTVGVALAYLIGARIGFSLAFAVKQVSAVWPPTGIAVAALLLFGWRAAPGVLLGAFAANAMRGEPLSTALGIALGNTLGPIAAWLLLVRVLRFDARLARARDAVAFVLAAGVTMAIPASNGVVQLAIAGVIPWSAAPSTWWVWWIGDTMGVILLAPALLTMAASHGSRSSWPQRFERAAFFLVLAFVGHFALAAGYLTGTSAIKYVVFPFVIWAALRFGPRETALTVALVAGLAIWGMAHDGGAFPTGTSDAALVLLEAFLATMAFTATALAATTAERRAALAKLGADLASTTHVLDVVAEHSTDMILIVGPTGEMQYVSNACRAIGGYEPHELIGRNGIDMLDADQREQTMTARAGRSGDSRVDSTLHFRRKDGSWGWLESRGIVVRDPVTGGVMKTVAIARDITDRRLAEERLRERESSLAAAVKEKEALVKEVHHRVKNNLQVISSLLSLRESSSTPEAATALRECRVRVHAMALIHEQIYGRRDLASVSALSYLRSLAGNIWCLYEPNDGLTLTIDGDDLALSVDEAVPFGLIASELISNALKHAFPTKCGALRVSCRAEAGGMVALTVADDGVGLGARTTRPGSLGLELVRSLAGQLEGTLSFAGPGTIARLAFRASATAAAPVAAAG